MMIQSLTLNPMATFHCRADDLPRGELSSSFLRKRYGLRMSQSYQSYNDLALHRDDNIDRVCALSAEAETCVISQVIHAPGLDSMNRQQQEW